MTYTLRFLPEVEDDVISGYSWYETKSPGLGEEFLRMFYACAGDIPRNPSRGVFDNSEPTTVIRPGTYWKTIYHFLFTGDVAREPKRRHGNDLAIPGHRNEVRPL